MSLAQLQVFAAVATTGSVAAASDLLFKAQSAVSRSITEFEATIGHTLFERRSFGMLPTPVGNAVHERGARVLGELAEFAVWCELLRSRHVAASRGVVPNYLLNTRRLQLFIELCRHRNMQSAAVSMGISQPAVSAAVRTLEAGAGFPLFERSSRGLLLTEYGQTFELRVRRALNELRQIPYEVAALEGMVRGVVSVGALPPVRSRILPQAIARLSQTHRGVRVVTDERPYDDLLAELRSGDIDFVLGAIANVDVSVGLVTELLYRESMCALVRQGHPLARQGKACSVDAIQAYGLILPRQKSLARKLVDEHFRRHGRKALVATVETADLAVVRSLLLDTDMIAFLSENHVHRDVVDGDIVSLPTVAGALERKIGFTFRSDSAHSPAALALISIVRSLAPDCR
ncbi:LysR family transcriptional regulator [Pandoraea captiosa]|nr:LysR family transcriptional regulator [Pandoraea captiosa]